MISHDVCYKMPSMWETETGSSEWTTGQLAQMWSGSPLPAHNFIFLMH